MSHRSTRAILAVALAVGSLSAQFQRTVSEPVLTPQVSSPRLQAHATLTGAMTIVLRGSADKATSVEVAGPLGVLRVGVDGGRFVANVPLAKDRVNSIHLTSIGRGAVRSSATVAHVTQDSSAPILLVDGPANGSRTGARTVDVFGRVSDVLSGYRDLDVKVNGRTASVDVGLGTNGTFFLSGVPLTVADPPVPTTLQIVATDAVQNTKAVTWTVTHVPIPNGVPRLEIVSGNGQSARANTALANPLVVRVRDGNGRPFPDKVVLFEIVRSNGLLSTVGGNQQQSMLQVRTDSQGLAAIRWTLGSDAGRGNNRLRAGSRDVAGTTLLCASATAAPASRINVASGNLQQAESGSVAAEPLRAWVHDGCNGVAGVAVTFAVKDGTGTIDGKRSVTVTTSRTGHAEVLFKTGTDPARQIVEATFPGTTSVAAFETMTHERDPSRATSFVGIVLDNAGRGIGGVPLRLVINSRTLPTVLTNVDGRFEITGINTFGPTNLHVETRQAKTLGGDPIAPGLFPDMTYHPTLIPNTENTIGEPILVPQLVTRNWTRFDNTRDVTLTVASLPGLEFRIAAGSMRRKDGTRPSPADPELVAVNPVHYDEIPMAMPNGAAPPFAWTFQPSGATFDPPVQVRMPNMAGLAPNSVMYFLSFDHDTNRFEIVASGSVSADGALATTDPGSGIAKAGWGGFCPPYPATGSVSINTIVESTKVLCADYQRKRGKPTATLAHQIACIAEVASGYDCATGKQNPRPAWSSDVIECILHRMARMNGNVDAILPNLLPWRKHWVPICESVPNDFGWPGRLTAGDICFLIQGAGHHFAWHLIPGYLNCVPNARRTRSEASIRNEINSFYSQAVVPCFRKVAASGEISPWLAEFSGVVVPKLAGLLRDTSLVLAPFLRSTPGPTSNEYPALPPPLTKKDLTSETFQLNPELLVESQNFFVDIGKKFQLKVTRKSDNKDLTKTSTGTRYFASDGDQVVPISADGDLQVDRSSAALVNMRPRLIVIAANGNEIGIGQFATKDKDTDGDLIVDSFEEGSGLDSKKFNPPGSDCDKDGLSDFHEAVIGTNPKVPDTDKDGVSDGDEIKQDSDPLDPRDGNPVVRKGFQARVGGRTRQMRAFGGVRVRNIPVNNNPTRLVIRGRDFRRLAAASTSGLFGASGYFDIVDGQTVELTVPTLTTTPPATPVSIAATAPRTFLDTRGATSQLQVTATLTDDSTVDVTARTKGTSYRSSNPQIVTVSPAGLVMAVGPGTAFVTVSNEGASTAVPFVVSFGDPATTVEGFVRLADRSPVANASVLVQPGGKEVTTDASGKFRVTDVATALGRIHVSVQATVAGKILAGSAGNLEPFAGGITDAGVIELTDAVVWNVDSSGFWDVAANWSGNRVPQAGDHVVIDRSAGDFTITVRTAGNEVRSLRSAERLTLAFRGALTVREPFRVDNLFTISQGTLRDSTVFPGRSGQGVSVRSGNLDGVVLHTDMTVQQSSFAAVTRGLELNGSLTVTSASLIFRDTSALTGRASITLTSGSIRADTGRTVTIGPDIVITSAGFAQLTSFVNLGTVRVSGNGSRLTLNGNFGGGWQNLGSIATTNGASLTLDGTNWQMNQAISVEGGGSLRMLGTFVIRNPVTLTGNGSANLSGNWSNDSTVSVTTGPLNLDGTWQSRGEIAKVGGSVTLRGIWTNTGTLRTTGANVDLGGTFSLADLGRFIHTGGRVAIIGTLRDSTLALNRATGTWFLLNGTLENTIVTTADGERLIVERGLLDATTLGDTTVRRGEVRVQNGLTLNGTTRLETGGLRFLATDTLTGTGTLEFATGTNALYANAGRTLTVSDDITVSGSGGSIGFPTSAIVNRGTMRITGPMRLAGTSWTNAGELRVASAGRVDCRTPLEQSAGLLQIDGELTGTSTVTLRGGELRGVGTIIGNLVNGASVLPAGPAVVGALTVRGDYTQLAAGTITIEIAARQQLDQLIVTGRASFAGKLTVTRLGSYLPNLNDGFDVITYASHVATFDQLEGLQLGSGRRFSPSYGGTAFRLVVVAGP